MLYDTFLMCYELNNVLIPSSNKFWKEEKTTNEKQGKKIQVKCHQTGSELP